MGEVSSYNTNLTINLLIIASKGRNHLTENWDYISWINILKSNSIGTPAAQVHDFSYRILLGPLYGIRNSRRRLSREFLGLIIGPDIVLGMLLHWPYNKIPPAHPLVFQGLHSSYTCCHNPSFASWIHIGFRAYKNLGVKRDVCMRNWGFGFDFGCWGRIEGCSFLYTREVEVVIKYKTTGSWISGLWKVAPVFEATRQNYGLTWNGRAY